MWYAALDPGRQKDTSGKTNHLVKSNFVEIKILYII